MKRPDSRAWYALVASLFFLAADQLHWLTRLLARLVLPRVELGLRDLLQVLLCFSGISVAHGFGGTRAARELGLRAPAGRALAFSLLASAPMLVVFGLTSQVNPKMTLLSVAVGCVIAPFAEEILFRAYLFRQLYRHARAGFWLSALIPSVLFALGHVYQADEPGELIGILAVTGLGSILGCWLFVRWHDNLWVVFGLHSLMNLWWEVFAVDETALGGWQANLARCATLALAIVLTLFKDRIWPRLPAETARSAASGSVPPTGSFECKSLLTSAPGCS
jgi:membrane protease YdiL (CAAX protease family)